MLKLLGLQGGMFAALFDASFGLCCLSKLQFLVAAVETFFLKYMFVQVGSDFRCMYGAT